MKLRDLVQHISIDPRKVLDYALNPANEYGRHMAIVFKSALGITRDNASILIEQIEAVALDGEAKIIKENIFGRHVCVHIEIIGNQQQRATVRTGWLIEPDSDTAHLVTVFIKERR